MLKIITGFRTFEDVQKTLEWIENNTNYVWCNGGKPVDEGDQYIKTVFKDYNNNQGGFYISYENNFGYGSINFLRERNIFNEQINFKDLIGEEEFVEGEEVYISDVSIENALNCREKRIYLITVPGNARHKYLCVAEGLEKEYKNGKEFIAHNWRYIVKIPKEKIKISKKDIAEKFGIEEKLIELI